MKTQSAMILTLSSLVAPEGVVTTPSGATSVDKVGIMTTNGPQWLDHWRIICLVRLETWKIVLLTDQLTSLHNFPFRDNVQRALLTLSGEHFIDT